MDERQWSMTKLRNTSKNREHGLQNISIFAWLPARVFSIRGTAVAEMRKQRARSNSRSKRG